MDETILRLKGVAALLNAISEVDDNTVIADLGVGIKLVNDDLLLCIKELEELTLKEG